LSLKNSILFLLFLTLLSAVYYLYLNTKLAETKSEPLAIEPITVLEKLKVNEEEEILLKLKEVIPQIIEENKLSPEEEAIEILVKLEERLPPISTETLAVTALASAIVVKNAPKKIIKVVEKPKVVTVKKKKPTKKKVVHKRKKIIKRAKIEKKHISKKRVVKRKKLLKKVKIVSTKNSLSEKEKQALKKSQLKLEECRERRIKLVKKLNSKKSNKEIKLGVVSDSYQLSKSERDSFKNLEVLSVSKPFAMEETPEIKNPRYIGNEIVDDKNLKFVETLGVVCVSTPYVDKKLEEKIEVKEELLLERTPPPSGKYSKEELEGLDFVQTLGVVETSKVF